MGAADAHDPGRSVAPGLAVSHAVIRAAKTNNLKGVPIQLMMRKPAHRLL